MWDKLHRCEGLMTELSIHPSFRPSHRAENNTSRMVRPSGMVGVGLLVLSLPQQAAGMTLKQKQRAACDGMSTGAVSPAIHTAAALLSRA